MQIEDEQLIELSVKELNRHLKLSKMTKQQVLSMKQRRRTLKNRGYAACCRNKRFELKSDLENQRQLEQNAIMQLEAEIEYYRRELSAFRDIREN